MYIVAREEELAAISARAKSAEAKARTSQLEATQAQAALNEVCESPPHGTCVASQHSRDELLVLDRIRNSNDELFESTATLVCHAQQVMIAMRAWTQLIEYPLSDALATWRWLVNAAKADASTSLQVLAARRGGREALTEMASQNARLVVGYCAKKAELKRIQEALAAEQARWEVTDFIALIAPLFSPCG